MEEILKSSTHFSYYVTYEGNKVKYHSEDKVYDKESEIDKIIYNRIKDASEDELARIGLYPFYKYGFKNAIIALEPEFTIYFDFRKDDSLPMYICGIDTQDDVNVEYYTQLAKEKKVNYKKIWSRKFDFKNPERRKHLRYHIWSTNLKPENLERAIESIKKQHNSFNYKISHNKNGNLIVEYLALDVEDGRQ